MPSPRQAKSRLLLPGGSIGPDATIIQAWSPFVLSRFAESRRNAAFAAAAYAVLATGLALLILRRAYVSDAIAGPIPFAEMRRVCAFDQDNPECALRLAIRAEQDGVTSTELWKSAVELNRLDSSVLIQAALAHESTGDLAQAETLLLEAANRSRTWLPRWSLANFYHRRRQLTQLAQWARLALERGYGDRTPLFSLCLDSGFTHLEVLERAVPMRHAPSIEAFMEFLRSRPQADDVLAALVSASAALRETGSGGELMRSSVDQLVLASDYLLQARQPEQAHEIWIWLQANGALPPEYRRTGETLANASFSSNPLAAPAFGWVMAKEAGVEILPGIPPGHVKMEFSGKQPDSFVVMSQCIRLEGGGSFRFTYEASGSGESAVGSHFRWTLSDWTSGKEIAVSNLGNPGAEQWTEGQMLWQSPAAAGFYRLALIYARPLGSPRLTGELRIRAVRLEGGVASQ